MPYTVLPNATDVRPDAETSADVTWSGVLAGLVGYATVAVLVGIFDVVLGRSFFFTPSLLGEALFYGLSDPNAVVVWPGAVFAYNGVHLGAFLFTGIAGAWLVHLGEKGLELWFLGIVLFLLLGLHVLGVILLLTAPFRSVLPAWMILVPTVVGLAAVAATLGWEHPRFRHELATWRDD